MSFDGVFTHGMVHELQATLSKGRISKIHQPYDNEVILIIRNQGKNHKLLLSAHPAYARMQLTTNIYQNPTTPPNFCMTLRKYLEGAILEELTQIDNDRVVHISVSKRNELGDMEQIVLIVELMGRHSAIILVNQKTGKILDCVKHLGPSQNSYRTLLPGATYVAPPKQTAQRNPFNPEAPDIFAILSTTENLTPQVLQENFQGLGKDTAMELVARLVAKPNEKLKTWRRFFEDVTMNRTPTLSHFNNKEFFTPLTFSALGKDYTVFSTLSELLEAYYEGKAERERVKQQAGELIRKIENEYKKSVTKLKKLEKSLDETENAEEFRRKGELLTTFLHQITKGVKEVTLENYYEENAPITITLRQDLSPSQNAQKYFQKYGKLNNGVKIIQEQLVNTKKERDYLESVLSQIELASPLEIEFIREELLAGKYIKPKQSGKQKKSVKQSKPEKYRSSDGTLILVGKNNLQNDQLTLKTANKRHIWLHAKDIPGSHVIIEDATPSEEALMEAANLAGYFSKYRLSASVPIDYVQVKHVKKPNGAKPGYVIYDNQKTLYVTPSKELMESLKEK